LDADFREKIEKLVIVIFKEFSGLLDKIKIIGKNNNRPGAIVKGISTQLKKRRHCEYKVNLEECFGKSYEIKDPITWRFKIGKKHHWVAEEIQKTFKNGNVSVENLNRKIKVHF